MTTEPINTDGPFPDNVNCPLHAKALSEIKSIVLDTRQQVIELKEIGGPLVEHERAIDASTASAARAHKRLDTAEIDIATVKRAQSKILVKLGAVMAPISAGIGALIGAIVAGMSSNG